MLKKIALLAVVSIVSLGSSSVNASKPVKSTNSSVGAPAMQGFNPCGGSAKCG